MAVVFAVTVETPVVRGADGGPVPVPIDAVGWIADTCVLLPYGGPPKVGEATGIVDNVCPA